MTVTVDQVMAMSPCPSYSRERIEELAAGRDVMTATDVYGLDISPEDRIWVLLHTEFLTDTQMHELWRDFIEHVAHLCDSDQRADLATDADAARSGKWDASTAAWNIAWATTRVAGAVTGNAPWDPRCVAEQQWQLDRIMNVLANGPVARK